MQHRNHHFSFTIPIDASIDNVWQALIDVNKWHVWDTELVSAKLDGSFAEGATGTMKPKTGPALPFTIADYNYHKAYTIIVKMPIGKLVIKRSLSELNNQICFTDDIAFTGLFKHIFGFVLGKQFKKVLPEVLQNFKTMVEK